MSNVWITGAARTPIGRFLGELTPFSAPELAGIAIRASMERSGVQPDEIDEVVLGNPFVPLGVGISELQSP